MNDLEDYNITTRKVNPDNLENEEFQESREKAEKVLSEMKPEDRNAVEKIELFETGRTWITFEEDRTVTAWKIDLEVKRIFLADNQVAF